MKAQNPKCGRVLCVDLSVNATLGISQSFVGVSYGRLYAFMPWRRPLPLNNSIMPHVGPLSQGTNSTTLCFPLLGREITQMPIEAASELLLIASNKLLFL
jgi:hypothetical protein